MAMDTKNVAKLRAWLDALKKLDPPVEHPRVLILVSSHSVVGSGTIVVGAEYTEMVDADDREYKPCPKVKRPSSTKKILKRELRCETVDAVRRTRNAGFNISNHFA